MATLPPYALHRAVILRDYDVLQRLLDNPPPGLDLDERDAAGNPALHYAAHLGYRDIVTLLLEKGADVTRKNAALWSGLQEALAARHSDIVRDLLNAMNKKLTVEYEKRLPNLLALLNKMPDFYMELKWEFHSWVPLVSRMCPSDDYKIWKKGDNLRIDTTLVGFENMKWIRGDISFIFKGNEGGLIYVLDHKKKNMQKLSMNPAKPIETTDREVSGFMRTTTLTRASPITDKVKFTPVKTWLGYEKTEKIGDDAWEAKVYNVTGFDLKILNRKRRQVEKSESPEELIKSRDAHISELMEKHDKPTTKPTGLIWDYETASEKTKSFKGTVWISKEFPRTTEELMPIFEILSPSQKHFDKLNSFISMKMPESGFPVKLEIPVYPTVSGTVTFITHVETEVDQSNFTIPDYEVTNLFNNNNNYEQKSDGDTDKENFNPLEHSQEEEEEEEEHINSQEERDDDEAGLA
eukprot:TRINITY_DN1550_c2_g1_i1.p1 TRINITY_DN1550_c2_g1~~TRINITY_DN1550_c2_g1_i1.p1  ORF type:complete len:465 (+),score=101.27 TRINITY_DN1550_c2_g1_i1:175-1569(+)